MFELIAPSAKFWDQHLLGPIPVFPGWLAARSLHNLFTHTTSQGWQTHNHDFVFVLFQERCSHKLSQKDLQTYGSSKAKQLGLGGGPFFCQTPKTWCSESYGSLDTGWDNCLNNDYSEGLRVFVNNTRNKRVLRKKGALPDVFDTPAKMKIHRALGDGQWRRAPEDTALMSKGLIEEDDGRHKYARREGLLEMSTYNGYVWRIVSKLNAQDPNQRDTI